MTHTDTEQLTITRTFSAPRALVWQAWTDPASLAQWWGPKGCTIRVINLDLRPGGMFHYAMAFPGGPEMFGRFIYREIAASERLVWVSSFSDAEGGITRAPFPQLEGKWPLEVLNDMALTEEDGKTMLFLHGGPINATDEERRIFIGNIDGMRQGFGGSFDKLDEFLAKRLP